MYSPPQTQEALIAFEHRVTRLEELYKLHQAGELNTELLEAAITEAEEATEADRDLFYEIFQFALGPLDLDRYGRYMAKLETWLEGYQELKELHEEGIATDEQLVEAYANIWAFWRSLAPWRDEIRRGFEHTEAAIEAERKKALLSLGYRIPTEKKPKKVYSEVEAFRRRLVEMTRKARR